jgi:hypothetical protein
VGFSFVVVSSGLGVFVDVGHDGFAGVILSFQNISVIN